ncbi:MAG: Spx/MgsR family RNA polymerase-binding regulatory protein [Chlamydiae bacterium]|nr:Spx/MgsR family RNA polymerase-binding regulatory protein [Chlamydiota bacterium]
MDSTLYVIDHCTTCKKGVEFLKVHNIGYKKVSLKEKAPTLLELSSMLEFVKGDVKKLFNTSGLLYKEMNLKDKLMSMSQDEKLILLSREGMLVKRPFLLTKKGGLVGFKEKEWSSLLQSLLK